MTTCARCPSPADRLLGTEDLCHGCAEHILTPLRAKWALDNQPESFDGTGRLVVPRPDYGPGWADLQCDQCKATWVGPVGDTCWWCERSRQLVIEHQAEKLTEAPDIDPEDVRYPDGMRRWAGRLADGVKAEIITESQANAAWRRALRGAPNVAA